MSPPRSHCGLEIDGTDAPASAHGADFSRERAVLLEAVGISKAFGSQRALDEVCIDLRAGEVHLDVLELEDEGPPGVNAQRGAWQPDADSRAFLSIAMGAASGLAALFAVGSARAASIPRSALARAARGTTQDEEGNTLERMLRDLDRALAKPTEQRKLVMVIDLRNGRVIEVSGTLELRQGMRPGVVGVAWHRGH